jgi:hypothetical protein
MTRFTHTANEELVKSLSGKLESSKCQLRAALFFGPSNEGDVSVSAALAFALAIGLVVP